MAASVNVTRYVVLHQHENLNGICKCFFFCFSPYTNSQTLAKRIAAKRQNLTMK